MRRDVSAERVLFVVVLSCSLLFVSVALLRGEMSTPTRTFRDGFIVADRVERRVSSAPDAVHAVSAADSSHTGSVTVAANFASKKQNVDTEGTASAPKAIKAAETDGAHTTTIKMADGDEITIKRAANSKNKITTISAHEDGKITIENREKEKEAPDANDTGAPSSPLGSNPETTLRRDAVVPADEAHAAETTQRAVDFVDVYEADDKDGDAVLDEAGAGPTPATTDKEAEKINSNDETEEDENAHEVVVGNKEVTFVQVGRTLTKVSLSDVHDGDEEAQRNSGARQPLASSRKKKRDVQVFMHELQK